MTPNRWRKIDSLFQAALEQPPSERSAFLARVADEALRQEVESLLASERETGHFIESPALEVAAPLLAITHGAALLRPSIGHYRILAHLGAGGMGEVYLAHDSRLNRKVALKLLPDYFTKDTDRVRRFQQEARAASSLSHPNIITIYDIEETEGRHYISMEHVEGKTLASVVKEGPLDTSQVVAIGIQVVSALQEVHAKGIIHRDIKPSNIMITLSGQVKIVDFGLAKVTETAQGSHGDASLGEATGSGIVMGTMAYMSPEQALGRPIDHRTDLYSLGVVLFQLATGHLPDSSPGSSAGPEETVCTEEKAAPGPPNAIPAGLERILRKCMEMDLGRRYQSAWELLADLRNLERGIGSGTPTLEPEAIERKRPARRTALAAVALLTSALIGAGLYLSHDRGEAIESLAILPLVHVGGDSNTEYLSEGIAASLISRLSELPKLKVIALNSTLRYKGQRINPKVVGKELGVRALLIGRMLQQGDDVTIDMELVDVQEDRRLWGQELHRKLSALMASQAEISWEIAEKLHLRLSGEQAKRLRRNYTEHTEAYQLYLKGRYFLNNIGLADPRRYEKSMDYFRKAIDIEPNFALAHSGLADVHWTLNLENRYPPAEIMPKAKAAALSAHELDDTLAETHYSLASVKMQYDWDFASAEREFKRTIEINPNYAAAYHGYAVFMGFVLGRPDEAVAIICRAQELDPLSLPFNRYLGQALTEARRYDEAIEQYKKTLELYPDEGHQGLARVYALRGWYEQALSEFKKRRSGDVPGWFYAMIGKKDDARKAVAALEERSKHAYVSPVSIAAIYALLGERDRAFEWLERGYQQRVRLYPIRLNANFDSLRSDPRYVDLMRRVGLPHPEWRSDRDPPIPRQRG